MTTDLEEPADLIDLVGQQVGTTDWMKVTQEQLNPLADATGHQWIRRGSWRLRGQLFPRMTWPGPRDGLFFAIPRLFLSVLNFTAGME